MGLKFKFCNKNLVKAISIKYDKDQEITTNGKFSLKVQTFLNPTTVNKTDFINLASQFETKYQWVNGEGFYGLL